MAEPSLRGFAVASASAWPCLDEATTAPSVTIKFIANEIDDHQIHVRGFNTAHQRRISGKVSLDFQIYRLNITPCTSQPTKRPSLIWPDPNWHIP